MEVLISEYMDFIKLENRFSDNTLSSYKTDLIKYFDYLKGNDIKSICDVDKDVIDSYINAMKTHRLAPSTISRKISVLRAFCKYLMDRNVIQNNPMENIKGVKVQKRKCEPVSRIWASFVINLPNIHDDTGYRDRAVFEIIYGAGMRIGELIKLKVSDIDFESGTITCGSGSRRRTVPMYQRLTDTLSAYIKYERPRLLKGQKTEFLLVNKNGGGFSRQGLWKLIKRYFDRIPSAEGVTPDKLRQSLAVHLFESGVDRTCIQEFMGYRDIYSIKGYAEAAPRRKRYVLKSKNKKELTMQNFEAHPRAGK